MTDNQIIALTKAWLEEAVIGLNLCPFAESVHRKGQIAYHVSRAEDEGTLMDDLIATGGTMMAGKKLLERLGAEIIEGAAIVTLPELGGEGKLRESGLSLFTLVDYSGH